MDNTGKNEANNKYYMCYIHRYDRGHAHWLICHAVMCFCSVVDILLNKDKYTTVATKMQACSERARGVRGLVPTGKF